MTGLNAIRTQLVLASFLFLSVFSASALADPNDEVTCPTPPASEAALLKTVERIQAVAATQAPAGQIECSTERAPSQAELSMSSQFLMSMGSAATTSLQIYPLEQLKTRLQNGTIPQASDAPKTLGSKLVQAYGPYSAEKGLLNYIGKNVYKGVVPYTVLTCSTTGIIYPLHDIFQQQLKGTVSDTASNSLGATAAAAISNVVNIPQYNYRNNQSLADLEGGKVYTPSGFVKAAVQKPILATRGLTMGIPYTAATTVYYTLYERFKQQQQLNKNSGKTSSSSTESEMTLFNNFLASSEARFLVSFGIHPADTVRIRKQKTGLSYPQIAKDFYNQGGISRFYKGLTVAALRNSLSTGISMALYETIKGMWSDSSKKSKGAL